MLTKMKSDTTKDQNNTKQPTKPQKNEPKHPENRDAKSNKIEEEKPKDKKKEKETVSLIETDKGKDKEKHEEILIQKHKIQDAKKVLTRNTISRNIFTTLSIVKDKTADPCGCGSLREAITYTIFVIFFIAYVICTNHAYKVYKGNQPLSWHFKYGYPQLDDINHFGMIFPYLENTIKGTLFSIYDYDSFPVRTKPSPLHVGKHVLMGKPRLRQLRTRWDSCPITNGYFKTCYAPYGKKSEDRTPFQDETGSSIWSDGGFTYYIWGQYYRYPRSNRGFSHILLNEEQALEELQKLIRLQWIDRGTRAIFLEVVLYFPNNRLITAVTVIIETTPAGYIWTFLDLQQLNSHYLDMFVLESKDVLFYLQFAPLFLYPILLIDALIEIFHFRIRYIKRFWTYIDLSILILVPLFFIMTYIASNKCHAYVKTTLRRPNELTDPGQLIYYNLIVGYLKISVLVLISLKLFKFTTLFGVMGQIILMFETCAGDLLRFFVTFLLVLNAFALYMLCVNVNIKQGRGLNYKYYSTSIDSLLRVATGNLITERKRHFTYPMNVFYIIFFLVVDVLLASLIMAILNNGYMEFMTELVFKTSRTSLCDKLRGTSTGAQNAPLENLMIWLKILHVKNSKMYMLFSRFNLNPIDSNVNIAEFKEELIRSTGIMTKMDQVDENKITLQEFNERSSQLEQLSNILKQMKIKMLKFRSKCEYIVSAQKRKDK